MKKISKKFLTIDIDEGSIEVKENIIANTGDMSLNDLVLAFNTKTEIVFCMQSEITEAFKKLPSKTITKCFTYDEITDFCDDIGEEVTVKVMNILESHPDRFFYSLQDAIWEAIEQTKDIYNECFQWLKLNGIECIKETDTGKPLLHQDGNFTFELSEREMQHRAELWREYFYGEEQKKITSLESDRCPLCRTETLEEDEESVDSGTCSHCGEVSYFQDAIKVKSQSDFPFFNYEKNGNGDIINPSALVDYMVKNTKEDDRITIKANDGSFIVISHNDVGISIDYLKELSDDEPAQTDQFWFDDYLDEEGSPTVITVDKEDERVEVNAHNFKVIVSTEDMKTGGVCWIRIELANGEDFEHLASFDDLDDNGYITADIASIVHQ